MRLLFFILEGSSITRFVGYGACRRTAWQKRFFSILRFRYHFRPAYSVRLTPTKD